MPITTVIVISLLFLNLCLTLIMFWIIHELLSATKSLMDMEELSKHAFDLCSDQITDHSNTIKKLLANENEMCDSIKSGYDAVCDAYKLMRGQYDSIVGMNTKLLECWKGCEERYSQSYELFKYCSDNLKEVSFQLADLANVLTEDEYTLTLMDACDTVCLDCPYEDCRNGIKYKDKMLDCPVWKIKSEQREIEAELKETDEFLQYKARNELSDDDYRDAVNTHPEEDD